MGLGDCDELGDKYLKDGGTARAMRSFGFLVDPIGAVFLNVSLLFISFLNVEFGGGSDKLPFFEQVTSSK